MKFTIITVCFNEEASIKDTIESVLFQDYVPYEYIICDGGSKDNSVKIANSYKKVFTEKGIAYTVHSEKDGGIYFGMNIGIKLARGEYLNFMNAGDKFHDKSVLSKVSKYLNNNSIDILYGNAIYVERGYGKLIVSDISQIKEKISICHQSMFIKTDLIKNRLYDTQYKIAADYDFTLAMSIKGKIFKKTDIIVADIKGGGANVVSFEDNALDVFKIQTKAGLQCNIKDIMRARKVDFICEKIKSSLPCCIWDAYNMIRKRKKYLSSSERIFMEKVKVGIDAHGFCDWAGGIDFISTIAEALEYTGEVQTYLLIGKDSFWGIVMKKIKQFFQSRCRMREYKKIKKGYQLNMAFKERAINGFKYCSPQTIPIIYKKIENRFINNCLRKEKQCVEKNSVSIIMPSMRYEKFKGNIPQIGYIFDFQHKYLKEYFSDNECQMRDKAFKKQVKNSKYILVNAYQVKNDILKYYPEYKGEIIVLPFKPFQKPKSDRKADLKKYSLPKKYYIISNQFWMHKSHITAFEALEEVYEKGYTDLHIVCTGKLEDNRNPVYIDELKERISKLKCKNNIHLLGFIPKSDQIEIMKNAIGLIQPTLFEGTPGGLAVYNALCLGITCLVSDIPVNKEIAGYENVYFFEAKNFHNLAVLMADHINDKRIDDKIVNQKIQDNKREYGEFLLGKINEILIY